MTPLYPHECLVPDQTYLLSLRIKLDHSSDGTLHGQPTTCANATHSDYCPHIRAYFRTKDHHGKDQTLARLYHYNAPNYGEWYTWTTTFTLNEEQLVDTNIFSLVRLYHADPGVDVSMDHFRISLPAESTYPNPNDLCGDLILNGNAEVRKKK